MSEPQQDVANPRWLYQEYVDRDRTAPEMADELGVSMSTVCKWLDYHGIETGGRGYEPEDTRYRDADWLEHAYLEREMTVMEIADVCDVAKSTISQWLSRHEIPSRSTGMNEVADNPMQNAEVAERHPISGARGPDHPMWAGGNWRENGPWGDARDATLERDNYRCQFCGLGDSAHKLVHDEDLHAHHVTPVSEGGDKYELGNLLTLCKRCHTQLHSSMR
jgi:predicted transcriptional regulator